MKFDPDLDIQVLVGVYEPAEDSHLLLEAINIDEGMRVLEVGTGTGFIALHCARAGAMVSATDINPRAVQSARCNAERNGIVLEIILTDLAKGIKGTFDVIIFNPPYLPDKDLEGMEPSMRNSISGGEAGSELSIRFLNEVKELLAKDGKIYLLTSSESEDNVLAHGRKSYQTENINEKKLFFEALSVHRLTHIG